MSPYRDRPPCTDPRCIERHQELLTSRYWRTGAKVLLCLVAFFAFLWQQSDHQREALVAALDAPSVKPTGENDLHVDAALAEEEPHGPPAFSVVLIEVIEPPYHARWRLWDGLDHPMCHLHSPRPPHLANILLGPPGLVMPVQY